MKCTNCDGTGKEKLYDKLTNAYLLIKCAYCNGTGEVEQTEQEYIQTCNTEQLAETIHKMLDGGLCDVCRYDCRERCFVHTKEDEIKVVVEWLKQPHHESVSNCNE